MKRKIGNTDLYVSVIGLGTQQIGGGSWWGKPNDDASIRTIHAAINNGINLIDTAPLYGFGHAEEIVGKAIKGKRDRIIVSTKCGLWWQSKQKNFAFVVDHKKVYKSLTRSCIEQEIDMSLLRLQTDFIDIYHVHVPDDTADINEITDCLSALKTKGKIRYIAVSNMSIEQCIEYHAHCVISANQIKRNLLAPLSGTELTFYAQNNIAVLAYAPLEQGLLNGKITEQTILEKTDYRNNNPWFKPENRSNIISALHQWSSLLEKYKCTLPQLVLSCTLDMPGITATLCGSRNENNIQESAAAMQLTLDGADKTRMISDMKNIYCLSKTV